MFPSERPPPQQVVVAQRHVGAAIAGTDITFASPADGSVTATLLEPTGTAASAGVLMLHWGFGNRLSFLAEAIVYARCGARVLLVDAPGMGARGKGLPALGDAAVARAFLVQCVTELRCGIDLLLQAGTPGMRLGYVGHSLGAAIGVPFCGTEDRLAASVLMTPIGDLSQGGWSLSPGSDYRTTMAPLDGTRLIGRARCALYFQFGTRDPWVDRGTAARLCAAAPKARSDWYEADHRLSARALHDRANWLCAQLALNAPEPTTLAHVRLPASDLWRHAITAPLQRIARRLAGGRAAR